MAKMLAASALHELGLEQKKASDPVEQVRLSASAGTGKTQVLTARVLRLLLHDVKPESILCLTFTKAGASEMADRIHERLGAWVTMPGGDLGRDLKNLGEDIGANRRDDARNLFARVLDARGSGLRIQTIHSFCQTLLASFPAEAGLASGFRPTEGREEEQLAAKALATMVEGYEREGRGAALERLRQTAKRLSEDATRTFLKRCAAEPEAMETLPDGDGLGAFVRRSLCGIDDIPATLFALCDEGGFDRVGLERLQAIFSAWRTKKGTTTVAGEDSADRIKRWLLAAPCDRIEMLPELRLAWLTGSGTWRVKEPSDFDYREHAERLDAWIDPLITLVSAGRIAPAIADALSIGRDFARVYTDTKRAAGVVDFNDLIRGTVKLLKTPGIGDWIKFKLDQQIDHILVDEAQDTNAAQWDIVKALAEEFFVGDGVKSSGGRTLFLVGDFKQSIFGFQGTDPREFSKAGDHFAALAKGAGRNMLQLALSESYRSSQPILDLTDAVIDELGFEAFGLPARPERHISALRGSGSVTLLPPVMSIAVEDLASQDEDGGDDERETSEVAEVKWARTLALQVKQWTTGGLRLRNHDRDATPGDVMILVRKRGDLARLIVSQLHQAGVAVAGVDRLRLNAPIAVQDLLACIRFALQPQDDLSLACILVSPLVGWSQEDLYDRAKQRGGNLWSHLKATLSDEFLSVPTMLLDQIDRTTPYQFLEMILSGPIGGRRKFIERLGEEARDPVEELLSQALSFETQAIASVQNFLDWFDRGDVDVKRDPSKPENAVRVMTVHGAKGLQAPIVVLADATSDPESKRNTAMTWAMDKETIVPLFRPNKADLAGPLQATAENQDTREMEEHWRLLYVAMTRAEEHLFIGGALKTRQQSRGMSAKCWHPMVSQALTRLNGTKSENGRILLKLEDKQRSKGRDSEAAERWAGSLPDWATKLAAPEARPPRPLAPSAIEVEDSEPSPPPNDLMRSAARRGVLMHALFERLPDVEPGHRAKAAESWLHHSAGVADPLERNQLVSDALSIIESSEFDDIFSTEARAEAPLAGVVNGRVVVGTVDRLLIREQEILVVDFKTGRRVPSGEDSVSRYHKAQMAAYAAVLNRIFPDRPVRAALLYTSGPKLIRLSQATLDAHKPGFSDAQQDLSVTG
jgi:ATP-dependent helicase/nuclease subunit A